MYVKGQPEKAAAEKSAGREGLSKTTEQKKGKKQNQSRWKNKEVGCGGNTVYLVSCEDDTGKEDFLLQGRHAFGGLGKERC